MLHKIILATMLVLPLAVSAQTAEEKEELDQKVEVLKDENQRNFMQTKN